MDAIGHVSSKRYGICLEHVVHICNCFINIQYNQIWFFATYQGSMLGSFILLRVLLLFKESIYYQDHLDSPNSAGQLDGLWCGLLYLSYLSILTFSHFFFSLFFQYSVIFLLNWPTMRWSLSLTENIHSLTHSPLIAHSQCHYFGQHSLLEYVMTITYLSF